MPHEFILMGMTMNSCGPLPIIGDDLLLLCFNFQIFFLLVKEALPSLDGE